MLTVIVPIMCVVSDFSCNLTLYPGHRITQTAENMLDVFLISLSFFPGIVLCAAF